MKRIAFFILFAFLFPALYAQQTTTKTQAAKSATDTVKQKIATADSTKQIIRTAADLKSGTSQDVLSSFFKLAYQNLSDGHRFQFSSSLFAVKAKTDTTLWIDTNYNKHVFLRNLVLGIDLGLDSSNKFKDASLSIKYALVNNRDKNIFEFRSNGKQLDTYLDLANRLYAKGITVYGASKPKSADYTSAINFCYPDKKHPKTKLDSVPKRFLNILDSLQKDKQFVQIKNFNVENLLDSLKDTYNTISGLMSQASLWTVGGQITTNQQNALSRGNLNTEYLKGITNNKSSMGLELDIKGELDIYDTTAVSKSYNRNVLSSSAGINWIIYKDKKSQKSYVEFKPALAYNNILSGQIPGETKSKFTGDGILRFRITDNLWLPIDIKYDPQSGKFFGLLNITSNFDWLGASKTLASAN